MRIAKETNKSVVLQELEILEKFIEENTAAQIFESQNYISGRINLNLEKIRTTNEEFLSSRFITVMENMKEYVTPSGMEKRSQKRKLQTLDIIQTLSPLESKNNPKYIVSMTSYKKRLADTAVYAIVTLFNQSVKPDKIILWVANEDKENIPQVMEKLVEKGLEIRFCEDIKSYKKLIPALLEFPDDYIITADDDVYYPREWLEELLAEHKKNPKKIICHRAHGIKVGENHNPLPYREWNWLIEPDNLLYKPQSVFPTGVGGILYPPKCFCEEVTNKELFMKLAPQADDIWFWATAVINKKYFGEESPYIVIENGCSKRMQDIDLEQTQGENCLWIHNLQGGNDKQIQAVIEYFPQIKDVLKKIEPYFNTDIMSMENDISVSIILPVFNAEQFIERGFNSIVEQTYRNDKIEVIFVDDCSTDNSVKILEKFIENYKGQIKFKIIKHTQNSGASQTRNTGIKNACGEYLFFMDIDDEITPHALLILANLARKYKGADIVQGNTYRIESIVDGIWELNKMWDISEYDFPEYMDDKLWIKRRLGMWIRNTLKTQRGYIPHSVWNKLISSKFIKDNNLFFQKNTEPGEDQIWNFFASKAVKSIAFTNYYSYIYHREHTVSLTKNSNSYINNRICACLTMLDNLDPEIIELQLKQIDAFVDLYLLPELNKLDAANKEEKEKFEQEAMKIKNAVSRELIKNLTSYDNDVKEYENPLVLVCVTTYNQKKYLRYCLNGILMQKTNFPFIIHLYDDCSTDGTSDVVREYASKYPNIIADIQPENLYKNGNGGEFYLRTKYKKFTDYGRNCKYAAYCEGDDYWIDPYKLQVQVNFLETHGEFSMCSGGILNNNVSTGIQTIDMARSSVAKNNDDVGFEYDFLQAHWINGYYLTHTLTVMYRIVEDDYIEIDKALKYKYFRDVHKNYYRLKRGKGYYFRRIFAVYNVNEGGVYSGLSYQKKKEMDFKVFEELYRETRDIQQLKFCLFARGIPFYVANCLETEEERVNFFKEFIQNYPELSEDIKRLIVSDKLISDFSALNFLKGEKEI